MDYNDFIEAWTGKRMALADFCEEYAQWERDNLPVYIHPDDTAEYPVLEDAESYALLHPEGVLYAFVAGVDGRWESAPSMEQLHKDFPLQTSIS